MKHASIYSAIVNILSTTHLTVAVLCTTSKHTNNSSPQANTRCASGGFASPLVPLLPCLLSLPLSVSRNRGGWAASRQLIVCRLVNVQRLFQVLDNPRLAALSCDGQQRLASPVHVLRVAATLKKALQHLRIVRHDGLE